MNVNRLRQLASPGPVAPLDPFAVDLRRAFEPEFGQPAEIGAGSYFRRGHAPRPVDRGSRRLESEPFCGDCHAIRSPLASEPCRNCGSTQPPNLSRMNPRARHQIGEGAYQ